PTLRSDSAFEFDRLSTTTTSRPACCSSSTVCEPMYPAPPVTSTAPVVPSKPDAPRRVGNAPEAPSVARRRRASRPYNRRDADTRSPFRRSRNAALAGLARGLSEAVHEDRRQLEPAAA